MPEASASFRIPSGLFAVTHWSINTFAGLCLLMSRPEYPLLGPLSRLKRHYRGVYRNHWGVDYVGCEKG